MGVDSVQNVIDIAVLYVSMENQRTIDSRIIYILHVMNVDSFPRQKIYINKKIYYFLYMCLKCYKHDEHIDL